MTTTATSNAGPTLVVRGATVLTMNDACDIRKADVVVTGQVISHVGKVTRLGPDVEVLDGAGHVLLPGFVQAHVHLCQALFRGMADDLPLLVWLKERIWPLEAAHREGSLVASAELGLFEMMSSGTTTILDMGTVHGHDAVMDAIARFGMRAFSGKAMMDLGEGVPKGLRESTRQSVTESRALARAWHGAAQGRIGYAYAPRFILSCSESLLRQTAEAASEDRRSGRAVLVHTHAAEHAAERAAVRALRGTDDIAALRGCGIAKKGTVIAHGVQLRAAEMRRMGREGTAVVHCPSANLKLGSGIANVPAMRAHGIAVGLGHDGAPCNNRMDAWTQMREAALLANVAAGRVGALGAQDALRLATRGGAEVLGLQAAIGSIEVGKKADFQLVRLTGPHQAPVGEDLYGTLVYATRPTDVRAVVVDGVLRMRDGELLGHDGDRVRQRAVAEARRVRSRAGL